MDRKVYSVRSNARRSARKQGIDPDFVVPVEGGFAIVPPEASKPESKGERLIQRLRSGWVTAADLMAETQWQAHSLRGAISTLAKRRGIVVERRRIEGVTAYRIAP